MKCTNCGSEGYTLTIYVNASTLKPDYICSRCQAVSMAKSMRSVEELDDYINRYEEMGKNMEEIVKEHPDMEVPEGLEGFAQTPMTAYKDILVTLTELKSRRLELLVQEGGEVRLQYELQKALEAEDYERSAELRDKLAQLNKEKNKE